MPRRVPKQEMRELLERRDGPAIRDTLLWFALIIGSGVCGFMLWGTWWAILPFMVYGVLYASTSDSRWHEPGHGTAFKTDWMNNVLYEIASFMVLRESTRWRWSHARHHSDTIIVGRDPEIAVTRPPNWFALFLRFFGINTTLAFFRSVLLHCTGRLTAEEKTFIPESEYGKVVLRARIYLLIYASVIGLAIYTGSILPLMFIGLPGFYGSWLQFIYGHTQHAGLAENVLDHRLNSRTIYMNAINRYLYWEMNYHVEHHMFPLVPYHNLAKLHELVKADMPKPYNGLLGGVARDHSRRLPADGKTPPTISNGSCPRRASAPTPRPLRTSSPPRASPSTAGSKSAPAASCEKKTSSASTTKARPTPSTARPTAIFTPPTASARTATPTWPTALFRARSSNAPSTTGASTSPTVRPGVNLSASP